MMADIYIRKCNKGDENEIVNICYRTGYMGEDLNGKNIFNDKKLCGYLFCTYYVRYELANSFVAVDKESNKISGYIIGSENTHDYEKNFKKKMLPLILKRLFVTTIWRYPESFKAVIHFIKTLNLNSQPQNLYKEYPAHLHINIAPEYQRFGIGSILIDKFEEHMKLKHISGIHLRTTNKNYKAVQFYLKRNYRIVHEDETNAWNTNESYKNVIFAKKLD